MSETLTIVDTIRKTGYTVINNTKVVEYVCVIPSDNPEGMRMTSTRLNLQMYKEFRDICRADLAEFEDLCYELQADLMNKEG